MDECIFCKIAKGEIPVKAVYQDESVIAFNDINPQSPIHILIIPKKHIPTILDIEKDDYELIGRIHGIGASLARKLGIADEGFRLVSNCNAGAGQSVFHLHFHLLGGRKLGWPPG